MSERRSYGYCGSCVVSRGVDRSWREEVEEWALGGCAYYALGSRRNGRTWHASKEGPAALVMRSAGAARWSKLEKPLHEHIGSRTAPFRSCRRGLGSTA